MPYPPCWTAPPSLLPNPMEKRPSAVVPSAVIPDVQQITPRNGSDAENVADRSTAEVAPFVVDAVTVPLATFTGYALVAGNPSNVRSFVTVSKCGVSPG